MDDMRVKQRVCESASYQEGVTFSGVFHSQQHGLMFPARLSGLMGRPQHLRKSAHTKAHRSTPDYKK